MSTFLTVKEAAQLTSKSASSIRRVIYPIIHDDNHPDRAHIQPGVEEAVQLRLKGENYAWRLSEELLRREFPADRGTAPSSRPPVVGDSELLAMLRRELDIKNEQITKQLELISGLSERLREGNVLIGTLQQRLALPDGRRPHADEPLDVKHRTSTSAAKRTKVPVATKPSKPKRGFWSNLFGQSS